MLMVMILFKNNVECILIIKKSVIIIRGDEMSCNGYGFSCYD